MLEQRPELRILQAAIHSGRRSNADERLSRRGQKEDMLLGHMSGTLSGASLANSMVIQMLRYEPGNTEPSGLASLQASGACAASSSLDISFISLGSLCLTTRLSHVACREDVNALA